MTGWLLGACEVLTCGSCFFRRPPVQTGSWARDTRSGTSCGNRRGSGPVFGAVIDWSCLMQWDRLNGHRCGGPAPQTPGAEDVFTLRAAEKLIRTKENRLIDDAE